MLHAVLIMSGSGLVLFLKEFSVFPSSSSLSSSGGDERAYISLSSKSGQFAAILTAILDFSSKKVGGMPTYIQCDHECISLATHAASKVTCAIFFDVTQGETFGALLVHELLYSFINTYKSQLMAQIPRIDLFAAFGNKLSAVVTSCIKPIIEHLAQHSAVIAVICAKSDGFTHVHDAMGTSGGAGGYHLHHGSMTSAGMNGGSGGLAGVGRERLMLAVNESNQHTNAAFEDGSLDSYTILSSQDALLNLALDSLSLYHDAPVALSMKNERGTVYLRRYEEQRCSLIVLYDHRKLDKMPLVKERISEAAKLVEQILVMAHSLKS